MLKPAAALLLAALLAAPSALAQAPADSLEALFWARQEAELERYTDADVAFMAGMIGHHAQALVMTQFAGPNGANPEVQTLAARIAAAQADEIRSMQQWLRDRGQPVPVFRIEGNRLLLALEGEPAGMDHGGMDHGAERCPMEDCDMEDCPMHGDGERHAGMDPADCAMENCPMHAEASGGVDHGDMGHGAMGDGGTMNHSTMPGMLSQAQLDRLAAARGADFDRLFLAYMIQHHSGAVTMVEDLFAADGAAQGTLVFRFASDVQVDQRTEIARMQLMLDRLTD